MIKMADNKTKLTIGMFILLSTIGTTYFVTIDDPVFYCESLDVVGMCNKLSKINADGLQTRCYYDLENPRKYKNCKTGWVEYEKTEFIGEEIDLLAVGFDINLSTDKKEVLRTKGILNPIINPCIKIDEFYCKANIYEKDGINKNIKITYKFCTEYEINQTTNETTNNCLDWQTLNQFEIQNELNEKANEILTNIADIQIQRNKKLNEKLTGEISLNIK